MSSKRIKAEGMSFSVGQISALKDLDEGAYLQRTRNAFFMRQFGASPTSCAIYFPEGVKYPKRERSKNEHMTCVTLIDKKLVEQDGKYEKVVGASYTRYKLSELGKKV